MGIKRYKVYYMNEHNEIVSCPRREIVGHLNTTFKNRIFMNPDRCNYTVIAKDMKELDLINSYAKDEFNDYLVEKGYKDRWRV